MDISQEILVVFFLLIFIIFFGSDLFPEKSGNIISLPENGRDPSSIRKEINTIIIAVVVVIIILIIYYSIVEREIFSYYLNIFLRKILPQLMELY